MIHIFWFSIRDISSWYLDDSDSVKVPSVRICSLMKIFNIFRIMCFFPRLDMRTYNRVQQMNVSCQAEREREETRRRYSIELLNTALWLTSFAYSDTYVRLNPARRVIVSQSRLVLPLCLRWREVYVWWRDVFHVSGYKLFLRFRKRKREREREREREGGESLHLLDLYNRILSSFLCKSISLVWHTTVCVQLTCTRKG